MNKFTATATAKYVFPVPAGPMPKEISWEEMELIKSSWDWFLGMTSNFGVVREKALFDSNLKFFDSFGWFKALEIKKWISFGEMSFDWSAKLKSSSITSRPFVMFWSSPERENKLPLFLILIERESSIFDKLELTGPQIIDSFFESSDSS